LPVPQADLSVAVVNELPAAQIISCRRLAEQLAFLIVGDEASRKVLYPSPRYEEQENRWLFFGCHALTKKLLGKGISVFSYATNLLEHH
jgi:hypothetical protein